MKHLTDEEALEFATGLALSCWEAFVECGGLKHIGDTLGPVGDYEARIFEAGWKLGFTQCLLQGKPFNKGNN